MRVHVRRTLPLLFLTGCLIEVPIGTTTPAPSAPTGEQLDVLFVVDNSGSMCEEQLALREALFGSDCPIQDLADPGDYLEASDELERCGLAQLLAAADVDFRVGFITTDVGACDNRYGFAETQPALTCTGETIQWGRRPQRGCLQAGPTWEHKWLARGDPRFQARLYEGLDNIGVFGSPFERGLDAVDYFLDPEAARAPGCERDPVEFLRPDAHLAIVFVTDEDDCSHRDGIGGMPDENAGESCSHVTEEFYALRDPAADPDRCYTDIDLMGDPGYYASSWLSRKRGRLSVFLLGGVLPDGGERPVPTSCRTTDDGAFTDQCTPSRGASNLTGPGQPCSPDNVDEPCCTADAANRYADVVWQVGQGDAASICGDVAAAFKRLNATISGSF